MPEPTSFDGDLRRILNHDLRLAFVLHDQSTHTDILAIIEGFWRLLKPVPLRPKYHDGEYVIGIGPVEIEEGWLALAVSANLVPTTLPQTVMG
jgi:hypothetical protein